MFKKGQRVVKLIEGGGTETASIREVVKVSKKKGLVYLDPDDICDDGQNTYQLASGRANVNWVPGFASRIVTLEEDSPKKITVLTDEDYNQALYVNGELQTYDDTIYAGDIEHAANGDPVIVETAGIEGYKAGPWPKTIEDAKPFYV